MAVGYNLLWDVLAFLPLVLMVVSYSRVVYTLWFKRNYDFQNNQHQMVKTLTFKIRQLTTRHVYKTYLIITCVKHIYYNFLDLKCCFPQQRNNYVFSFINTQGVIRVRKRVTLMVVAVSVIFGICSVAYTLRAFDPSSVGPVPIAIANTMVLFNAAINPFVYALLNQQFREKMKRLICCTSFCVSRVYPPSNLPPSASSNIS